jgi:nucleoside-triphosphatase
MTKPPVKNVLLTGLPGCGKTTVVRRVVERLQGRHLAGFYTQEIRREGRRLGFEAIGLGGRRAVLAHVELRTKKRVGRYGVDVAAFNAVVEAELRRPLRNVDLFVIDEIGKMECFSRQFVEAASALLDSAVPVLATIAAKGGGVIGQVKARPDVELFTVTAANREELPGRLVESLCCE